jgi:hypothetical protein
MSEDRDDEQRRRRDRMVERFNRRYCVVDDHGTAFIFKEVDNVLRPGFLNIYRLKEPDFRLLYKNKRLSVLDNVPITKDPDAISLPIGG